MPAPKRNAQQTRQFIATKVVQGDSVMRMPGQINYSPSPAGSMISGTDLQRAKAKIDLIPDEFDRRKLANIFATFPKYTALSMVLAAEGEWSRKYPTLVDEIAIAATELDDVIEIPPRF